MIPVARVKYYKYHNMTLASTFHLDRNCLFFFNHRHIMWFIVKILINNVYSLWECPIRTFAFIFMLVRLQIWKAFLILAVFSVVLIVGVSINLVHVVGSFLSYQGMTLTINFVEGQFCSSRVVAKQNRITEGCSKLKRSVDMTSSGKNGHIKAFI